MDKRRLGIAAGGTAAFFLVAGLFLWYNCGFRGCPDVDVLRGYVPEQASAVLDRNGEEISKLYVVRRMVVQLDSLPSHVPDAFIAIEDRRFWEHNGVDWTRMFGAMWTNLRSLSVQEGFSTLTMQLAGNVFPDRLSRQERTLWRKIGEMRVAREIERQYSKQEILEMYLNQIFFGRGAWGIEAAAQEYFGKPASELDLPEAALLAAVPVAPSRLNPRNNPEGALERRELVLRRMRDQGMISPEEQESARSAELELSEARVRAASEVGAYFVESVRRLLEAELGEALYTMGYDIHTTLDLGMQRALEEEIRRQLANIERGVYGSFRHPVYSRREDADQAGVARSTGYLQAAGVIMDATTGDVLALVGGRDFEDSEYNRATQSKRQPGSAFKPFVYAAAVARGYPPTHPLEDTPIRLVLDGGRVWEPRNFGGSYGGRVTLRNALVQSRNTATVRLAEQIGVPQVVRLAHAAGIDGEIPPYPSIVLGSAEVTLVDLVSAYTGFATLGDAAEPRYVTRVEGASGRAVYAPSPSTRRVMEPGVAFIITDILQDAVNRGTGTAVRAVGFQGAVAGKTGTTNEGADAWFIGYTPDRVGGIWIGLDEPAQIVPGATGGTLAAPIWGRTMRRAGQQNPAGWSPPPGVERRTVDVLGNVLGSDCPAYGETREEWFLSGTTYAADCYPAWSDTFPVDTTFPYGRDDDSWWERLRDRLDARDTLRELDREVRPADTLPRDTLRRPGRPDTLPQPPARPRPGGRPDLLGEPVDTTRGG